MQRNLIDVYLDYTRRHEAPEKFHFWTAISLIGATVGRRVELHRGYFKVYPGQIWVVVVAGAAWVRKSTSIGIGRNLLKRVGDVTIVPAKSSPESFVDSLQLGSIAQPNGQVVQKDSQALIFSSELAAFLSKQAYTEALIPILTDLFDAPDDWEYKTRTHGATKLKNVCVTFLAASTPDWLADAIPPNAFGGGFISRIIFVYADRTDRSNPFPTEMDLDYAAEQELLQRLSLLGQVKGSATLTPEARAWFTAWYDTVTKDEKKREEGYWGRRPDHLLRVALNVALGRHSLEINMDDLMRAHLALEDVEANMDECFRFVGATAAGRNQQVVLKALERLGGTATVTDLTGRLWNKMDQEEIMKSMQTLKQAGIMELRVVNAIQWASIVRMNVK